MKIETKASSEALTLPGGFKAAGICAGIKGSDKKDMALIVSDMPATVAGTFTTNQVKAAPVKLCKERLAGGQAQAIVVNSGIANASTGARGIADARRMTELTAECLGIPEEAVFVCSTGSIGKWLPMDIIESGVRTVAAGVAVDGGMDAAEAIMTTDTRMKVGMGEVQVGDKTVRLAGLAKGAGMIEPNMATMLAFLLTDAAVDTAALQECLSNAVKNSFNRISVDGDMSTNDTVLCLANSQAGNELLTPDSAEWGAFCEAVEDLAMDLALKMVEDGEGATKRVVVHVTGAETESDAEEAARAVANSLLIKTSWAGGTANWGRVMDALGYSKAKIVEEQVDIDYDSLAAVRAGISAGTAPEELNAVTAKDAFVIDIDLHLGEGDAVVYTCDCTEEYVRINV